MVLWHVNSLHLAENYNGTLKWAVIACIHPIFKKVEIHLQILLLLTKINYSVWWMFLLFFIQWINFNLIQMFPWYIKKNYINKSYNFNIKLNYQASVTLAMVHVIVIAPHQFVGKHESLILYWFLKTCVLIQVVELRFEFPIPYLLGYFALSIMQNAHL
jgi:hypothetical protein